MFGCDVVRPRHGRSARADFAASPADPVGGVPLSVLSRGLATGALSSTTHTTAVLLALPVASRRRREASRQSESRSRGSGPPCRQLHLSSDRLAFVRIIVRHGRVSVPGGTSERARGRVEHSSMRRLGFLRTASRIAFGSMRSGRHRSTIWLAAADGSGAQQLTRWSQVVRSKARRGGRPTAAGSRLMRSPMIGTPTSGSSDVRRWHTASTHERIPGDQSVPYWSRDGRWIYFSADRGSGRDIWRVAASWWSVTAR